VGSGLLVAGVMLAILKGRRDDESHAWEQTRGRLAIGVALGLVAALCQSVATLMLKPLMTSGIDAIAGSATPRRSTNGSASCSIARPTSSAPARPPSRSIWPRCTPRSANWRWRMIF
jgi:drug/metabolite transporter (DMT)-like permease